ncbi:peptidyl-prolyl cis-trans isomerase [Thalassotalea loyana]|uniref:Peptidyl-prolyl cis-trans isomerase n=1 Tax=Thalassotalea loyana TaxID=280483 RepID=A0ABQ6H8T1_9GAMM|nr:peptidylprolyl isomerase [Thalassotalea loyana]GLX84536.1 peptidyl-prolyl cis-trans isomerase [Thalassotalea loyana]
MYKLLVLICIVFNASALAKNVAIDPNNLFPQVKLETSKGTIVVELDRIKAPITVDNFLTYVVTGDYNNTIFHRVIEGFVVQGGGYDANYVPRKIGENIFNESGNGLKNETYTIAMAKENRPHTANRQFYFNMGDNTNLDPGMNWGYAVFGAVTEGEDVLEEIAKQKTDFNAELGWEDVPVEPIILIKATLLPAL